MIKKWIERLVISFQQDEQLMMLLQQFIQTLLASGGTEAIWGSNVQLALVRMRDSVQCDSYGTNLLCSCKLKKFKKTQLLCLSQQLWLLNLFYLKSL